jgi:hypothetical protein
VLQNVQISFLHQAGRGVFVMIIVSEKAQAYIREIIMAHKEISHDNSFVIMYSEQTVIKYFDGKEKTFGPSLSIHFESKIKEDERIKIKLDDDLTIFVGPKAFFNTDNFEIEVDGENFVLNV